MFISNSVAESLPLSSSPSFGAKVPQPLKQGQWLRGSLLLSWLAYLDYLAAAVEPATAAHPRQAAKRPASLARCHGPPKRGLVLIAASGAGPSRSVAYLLRFPGTTCTPGFGASFSICGPLRQAMLLQLCAGAGLELFVQAELPRRRSRPHAPGHIGAGTRSCGTAQLIRAGGGTGGDSPEEPTAVEETRDPGGDALEAKISARH